MLGHCRSPSAWIIAVRAIQWAHMACGSLLRKPRRTLARSGPLRPASAGEKGLGEVQGAILGGCYCFRRHRLLAAYCRGKPHRRQSCTPGG